MKASMRYILPLLLLALLLCGCMEAEQQIPPEEVALQQYKQAFEQINASGEYHLTATVDKQVSIGSEVFWESRAQKITCKGYGTDAVQLFAKETVTNGTLESVQSKCYNAGIGYLIMDDGSFSSKCTFEEFSVGLVPVDPIDITLYDSVSVEKIDRTFHITFQSPSSAETWAIPGGAKMTDAIGNAIIDENGEILEIRYDLTAKSGDAELKLTAVITPLDATQLDMNVPQETDCMRINALRAPELLETACGYLQQAVNIDSTTQSVTVSDAFGIQRTQNTAMNMRGLGGDFQADVQTTVEQIDSSRGETSVMRQVENFSNDLYTVTVDDEPSTSVVSITPETMKKYCQDILLGNILLPQFINEASATDSNGMYTISFNATKEMAAIIFSNVSQTLYEDPAFLESVSSEIETTAIKSYLTVDPATGLPIAAGLNYEGTHTIDSVTYNISYEFDQTYAPVNVSAEAPIEDK